jgi:hypothetical protein
VPITLVTKRYSTTGPDGSKYASHMDTKWTLLRILSDEAFQPLCPCAKLGLLGIFFPLKCFPKINLALGAKSLHKRFGHQVIHTTQSLLAPIFGNYSSCLKIHVQVLWSSHMVLALLKFPITFIPNFHFPEVIIKLCLCTIRAATAGSLDRSEEKGRSSIGEVDF